MKQWLWYNTADFHINIFDSSQLVLGGKALTKTKYKKMLIRQNSAVEGKHSNIYNKQTYKIISGTEITMYDFFWEIQKTPLLCTWCRPPQKYEKWCFGSNVLMYYTVGFTFLQCFQHPSLAKQLFLGNKKTSIPSSEIISDIWKWRWVVKTALFFEKSIGRHLSPNYIVGFLCNLRLQCYCFSYPLQTNINYSSVYWFNIASPCVPQKGQAQREFTLSQFHLRNTYMSPYCMCVLLDLNASFLLC